MVVGKAAVDAAVEFINIAPQRTVQARRNDGPYTIATVDCDAHRTRQAHVVGDMDNIDVGEDRKSVVSGKSVSVRVDPGGSRIIKKNIQHIKSQGNRVKLYTPSRKLED